MQSSVSLRGKSISTKSSQNFPQKAQNATSTGLPWRKYIRRRRSGITTPMESGSWGTLSYADIAIASFLFWFEKVLHEDEWEKVATWHDGQWARLLADVECECKVR